MLYVHKEKIKKPVDGGICTKDLQYHVALLVSEVYWGDAGTHIHYCCRFVHGTYSSNHIVPKCPMLHCRTIAIDVTIAFAGKRWYTAVLLLLLLLNMIVCYCCIDSSIIAQ